MGLWRVRRADVSVRSLANCEKKKKKNGFEILIYLLSHLFIQFY